MGNPYVFPYVRWQMLQTQFYLFSLVLSVIRDPDSGNLASTEGTYGPLGAKEWSPLPTAALRFAPIDLRS